MDERIRKLSDRVYLICGKVVCLEVPDMFDMTDPDMRRDMVAFAEDLYTQASELSNRMYGDETVCLFRYVDEEGHFTCEPHSAGWFRDDVQSAVRRGLALA